MLLTNLSLPARNERDVISTKGQLLVELLNESCRSTFIGKTSVWILSAACKFVFSLSATVMDFFLEWLDISEEFCKVLSDELRDTDAKSLERIFFRFVDVCVPISVFFGDNFSLSVSLSDVNMMLVWTIASTPGIVDCFVGGEWLRYAMSCRKKLNPSTSGKGELVAAIGTGWGGWSSGTRKVSFR